MKTKSGLSMKWHLIAVLIILTGVIRNSYGEEKQIRQLELEVEPVAYIFQGAGGHIRYHHKNWRFTIEAFGLNIPKSLHGNEGFEASVLGGELHFERFWSDNPGGFFIGPEVGYSQLEVEHHEAGSEVVTGFSAGLRAGYRWFIGLGGLYLAPVGGMSIGFDATDIEVNDAVFERGPFTPFVTVGIGWSFKLN